MLIPIPRAMPIVAALLVVAATAAVAADAVTSIATPGSGTLTMCRSWLFFSSCRDYNNVVLPPRIAVGDRLPLAFGSNPKEYDFPVARILQNGATCTLLSQAADTDAVEKIEVASCRAGSGSN